MPGLTMQYPVAPSRRCSRSRLTLLAQARQEGADAVRLPSGRSGNVTERRPARPRKAMLARAEAPRSEAGAASPDPGVDPTTAPFEPQVQSERLERLVVTSRPTHGWCRPRKGAPMAVEELIGLLCVNAGIIMQASSIARYRSGRVSMSGSPLFFAQATRSAHLRMLTMP